MVGKEKRNVLIPLTAAVMQLPDDRTPPVSESQC
jgi:hypothetical protein